MGEVLSKIGLYDLLARGVTGTIVLWMADLFGILELHQWDLPAWAIVVIGYFCGLVLEEISYLLEQKFHLRAKAEKRVQDDFPNYDLAKCKNMVLANEKEGIGDEPLAHVVMSSSLRNALSIFLVLELLDAFGGLGIVQHCFFHPWVDLGLLVLLTLLFHYRADHCSERRAKRIFHYCITKGYSGIGKKASEDTKDET